MGRFSFVRCRGALAVGVFALVMVALVLVSTTLHTIYTAALYRFATGGTQDAGIHGDLLAAAYRAK